MEAYWRVFGSALYEILKEVSLNLFSLIDCTLYSRIKPEHNGLAKSFSCVVDKREGFNLLVLYI